MLWAEQCRARELVIQIGLRSREAFLYVTSAFRTAKSRQFGKTCVKIKMYRLDIISWRERVALQILHELPNPLLYSLGGHSIDELASEYCVLETFQSTPTGNHDNLDACMKEIISIPRK